MNVPNPQVSMARVAGVVSALLLACISIYCFLQFFQMTSGSPSFAIVTFAVSAVYGSLVGINEGESAVFEKKISIIACGPQ